jgi:hypothetical protein
MGCGPEGSPRGARGRRCRVSARRTVSASALVRRIDRMLRRLGQVRLCGASKNIRPEALELWGRDLGVLRCDEKVAGAEDATP